MGPVTDHFVKLSQDHHSSLIVIRNRHASSIGWQRICVNGLMKTIHGHMIDSYGTIRKSSETAAKLRDLNEHAGFVHHAVILRDYVVMYPQ